MVHCYWQAERPEGTAAVRYPSLPEPYINLFFPVGPHARAWVKGMSDRADFLDMDDDLFGVRLAPGAWLRLGLGELSDITNRCTPLERLGHPLMALARQVEMVEDFDARVAAVRAFVDARASGELPAGDAALIGAIDYCTTRYMEDGIVGACARALEVSPRTIARWFGRRVGIEPKRLSRVARFHRALAGLHGPDDPGFFVDAGYFDQAHFIREFREFTGLSPRAYLGALPKF